MSVLLLKVVASRQLPKVISRVVAIGGTGF